MTAKIQGMNYALPATNDSDRICVTLAIPGDKTTISNFIGALSTLALWSNYRRDDAKRGKDIADVWKEIVKAIEFDLCAVPPPHNTGEEWEDELSICESLRFQNGKLQGFCCGEWVNIDGQEGGVISGPGVQPGGTTRPGPGESLCYNVELSGNNIWQLPFGVLPSDIITITDVSGAWTDGSPQWYCPNGEFFALGGCYAPGVFDPTDPAIGLLHMQLIAKINGLFYNYAAPITVPGVGLQTLTFQANDATLEDNRGSLSFNVCVQSGAVAPVATWCHTFGFTASQDGWIIAAACGVGCDCGEWAAGGFQQITGLCTDNVFTYSPYMASGAVVKRVVMEMNPGLGTAPNPHVFIIDSSGNTLIDAGFGGATWDYDWSANVTEYTRIGVGFDPNVGAGGAYANQITSVTLYGTGLDPFGASNC